MNILNSLRKNAMMRKLLPKGPLQPTPDHEANNVEMEVIDSMKEGDAVEMMKCTIRKCSGEEVRTEEAVKVKCSSGHAPEDISVCKQGDINADSTGSGSNVETSPKVNSTRHAQRLASKENRKRSRFQQQVLSMQVRKRRHHGRQEHVVKSRFGGKERMKKAPHVDPSKRIKITQPAKKAMLM